ncbi:hypothetical protein KUTeg_000197 [Tegillarca granosa]|uniref:C1q domain-containing protein n=1 Tax=Tegillarca granosa TaxID=220873 RepID=A0ABQ9FWW0_TEGGR|nr:hypothetical protein KUTeg_000197 [Tegillarca granosa]
MVHLHPPAVSFSAGKAATSTNRGVIKFENVLTNEGSGYNKDTGKFTAPYDGVYLFTWTIITRQKEAVATELYVNNVFKGYLFADARDATGIMDDSASNTLIVKMTRYDSLFHTLIRTHDASTHVSPHTHLECTFYHLYINVYS